MIECCADAIAFYKDPKGPEDKKEKIVLVRRLSEPIGYALPGGRLEEGESLEECIVREFKEETGMDLRLIRQLHTYSRPGRDPRGHKVSTVFLGEATGTPRNEPGKTVVTILPLPLFPQDLDCLKDSFAFDHYKIIMDHIQTLILAALS